MMQGDVKSFHIVNSILAVPYRTRLKGVVMMPYTAVTEHSSFMDDYSVAGSYTRSSTTATVTTAQPHGLRTGDLVYIDGGTGGIVDDTYPVTVTGATTFTITVADTIDSSGNVTVWTRMLFHFDGAADVSTSIIFPGEGIVAEYGIRVFIANDMHASIFYG